MTVEERAPKTVDDTIFTIRRSDTFRKTAQLVKKSTCMANRSCMVHGLMLMENDDELSLWNPSIRKSLILPCCPFRYAFHDVRCLLGFAPFSNDYKVVFFKTVDVTAFALRVAIYSLCDHQWRVKHNRIQVAAWCFEQLRGGWPGWRVVFAQGVAYWRPDELRCSDESIKLVCFDFDVEEISYLKLPDMEEKMFRFLFVLGGSLAVLGVSRVRSCIWVMEKNGGKVQWRQYWKGDTNLYVYGFFADYSYTTFYEIVYIEDTGMLLIQSGSELMAYNIRTNQTRCLGKSIRFVYVETYVESLVLHKGYKGAALASHG
ncbi:hypothetical protein RDABS01_019195 [Bienertia sinuspersici]